MWKDGNNIFNFERFKKSEICFRNYVWTIHMPNAKKISLLLAIHNAMWRIGYAVIIGLCFWELFSL